MTSSVPGTSLESQASAPDAGEPIAVSVILPTYNEAENIEAAVGAAREVLQKLGRHEILVIDDDSPDATWRIVDRLSREDDSVRCCRRIGERGLASAIFEGLAVARGEILVVMDADLQHDPRLIPVLVSALEDADIAVASRYVEGGSASDWSPARRWVSRLATTVGRRVLKLSVTDPMSGFFAIRRRTFESVAHRLRPRGFKALLEVLSRTRDARVVEVPYSFRPRAAGTSKLGNEVIVDYLLSLIELRTGRSISERFIKYCLVGLSGVVVQLVTLTALAPVLAEEIALALAILTAMLSNFVLNNVWTFREYRRSSWAFGSSLVRFLVVCTIGAGINHAASLGFHRLTGVALVWSSLVGIALATLWNYHLNRRVTWTEPTR